MAKRTVRWRVHAEPGTVGEKEMLVRVFFFYDMNSEIS